MQEPLQSLQDKQTTIEMREMQRSTKEAMMRAACWEMVEVAAGRQMDRSKSGAVEAISLILERWL